MKALFCQYGIPKSLSWYLDVRRELRKLDPNVEVSHMLLTDESTIDGILKRAKELNCDHVVADLVFSAAASSTVSYHAKEWPITWLVPVFKTGPERGIAGLAELEEITIKARMRIPAT